MRSALGGLVCALAFACACSDGSSSGPRGDTLPRLSAEGQRIVAEDGSEVRLRGVNLGAWLFHENWITNVDYPLPGRILVTARDRGLESEVTAALRAVGPEDGDGWRTRFEAELATRIGPEATAELMAEVDRYPIVYDDSDRFMRQLLEDRFGIEGRDQLLDVFWGAWIREPDIAWLAEQGFNVVRVPMTYRSLVVASDRSFPDTLVYNERAFERLDALLEWCDRYGLYAVLDLQESIGNHNDYSGPAEIYGNAGYERLTQELWLEIARRYRDRDVVAAYSLLAEPFGAPSAAERDRVYDGLVRAIRATGDDHLLVIHDGFFGVWTLPTPADVGWDGVVYSTHLFEFGITTAIEYQLLFGLYDGLFNRAQARQDVPYYIGSFSAIADQDFAYRGAELAVDLYERSGWSWSLWTFKRIDDTVEKDVWGISTQWGLLGRLASPFERPDLHRDSYADLERKLASYADLRIEPNRRLLDILTAPMR